MRPQVQLPTTAHASRREGYRALFVADLRTAETCFERAFDCARAEATETEDGAVTEAGRDAAIDLLAVDRASVAIELGTAGVIAPKLRTVLERSLEPTVRFHAAYALARHYRLADQGRHAAFYARIALRIAQQNDDANRTAQCLHLIGLLHLAAFELDEAETRLIASLDGGIDERRAHVEALCISLLAYCRALAGDERGLATVDGLINRSLAKIERPRCPLYEPSVHLNAGFARLEIGDPRQALGHGQTALEGLRSHHGLAARHARKNALFLVGEAACQLSDFAMAGRYFDVLQRHFYPDMAMLSDTLISYSGHKILNWLA